MLTLMYLSFCSNHDIDAPMYTPNIHSTSNHDINPPLMEDEVDAPHGLLNT